VGAGAHHLSFSPDQGRTWVALGESARTIVTLDTGDVAHPRVTGRFDPGFAVHDLSFSPDGQRVWITASSDSRAACSARSTIDCCSAYPSDRARSTSRSRVELFT